MSSRYPTLQVSAALMTRAPLGENFQLSNQGKYMMQKPVSGNRMKLLQFCNSKELAFPGIKYSAHHTFNTRLGNLLNVNESIACQLQITACQVCIVFPYIVYMHIMYHSKCVQIVRGLGALREYVIT